MGIFKTPKRSRQNEKKKKKPSKFDLITVDEPAAFKMSGTKENHDAHTKFHDTHRDADELICSKKTGNLLAAVYFSREGLRTLDMARFLRRIQVAMGKKE